MGEFTGDEGGEGAREAENRVADVGPPCEVVSLRREMLILRTEDGKFDFLDVFFELPVVYKCLLPLWYQLCFQLL